MTRRETTAKEGNMTRLRMAVIGVGHLGQHHARILAGLPDVDLVGVVDSSIDQAKLAFSLAPNSDFSSPTRRVIRP